MNVAQPLKVMVLAGGPDRERQVSLMSGEKVAEALRKAGHEVRKRDVGPGDLSSLDEFSRWGGDVVFPVLHGAWGEGGPLQHELDMWKIRYVGSDREAAAICMDKHRTKQVAVDHGVLTPAHVMLTAGQANTIEPPVVVKPPQEGSSLDLYICCDDEAIDRARSRLSGRSGPLMIEQFVEGMEITVSIIDGRALPAIHIIPTTEFYDYQAKYERQGTQYLFDIDLPRAVLDQLGRIAQTIHRMTGCLHLSRVDFIVDHQHHPWFLEVNTMPGFTAHSLLPMAAQRAGMSLPQLVDQLVWLAYERKGTGVIK